MPRTSRTPNGKDRVVAQLLQPPPQKKPVFSRDICCQVRGADRQTTPVACQPPAVTQRLRPFDRLKSIPIRGTAFIKRSSCLPDGDRKESGSPGSQPIPQSPATSTFEGILSRGGGVRDECCYMRAIVAIRLRRQCAKLMHLRRRTHHCGASNTRLQQVLLLSGLYCFIV